MDKFIGFRVEVEDTITTFRYTREDAIKTATEYATKTGKRVMVYGIVNPGKRHLIAIRNYPTQQ